MQMMPGRSPPQLLLACLGDWLIDCFALLLDQSRQIRASREVDPSSFRNARSPQLQHLDDYLKIKMVLGYIM